MQREVNINKTRPQYLWILCCNKMTCTVFTSLRQNTTLSDVTRNTFNILKRYWPGPRLIFFMGQIWSKPMFLNLWLDTTIMELSPDNLKIFTGVLPPVLVLQKHPKKGSQTFSFKKMLEFFFFFFLDFDVAIFACCCFGSNNIPERMVFKESDTLVQACRGRSGPPCSSSWPTAQGQEEHYPHPCWVGLLHEYLR